MRAFIAYQIQDRFEEDATLLKGGKLFQQFLVDAYATLEEDRLDFIRSNQNSLRSEVLKGIQDAVVNGDSNADDLGKRVILPSSYTGYKMEDRPDLVSRIFIAKLDDMIKYIKSGNPFGEIEADKEFDHNSYAAVSGFMMHGHCGLATQNSPCMEDDEESSWIKVSNDFLVHFDENPIESIVYSVYTDFEKFFDDSSYLREQAIVTPRNEAVSEINDCVSLMDITPVCALKPYEHGNRIRVRVCKMWTVKCIGSNSQALSLECVFVDKNATEVVNEEIRIILWADVAMNFDEQILATLSPPVFIAITSLKVKEYQGKPMLSSSYSTMCFFNPDVPQLFEYKKM
ncbi:hypothetical protein EZV62_012871 [Acer yangbiense]|uniref:Helitron helicase-like domain-containing protein n=1 Tax=Acer yangbiense TaxID=1000413 RepID=A0A5C7HXE8_9ROSI|nr:hypothetical protein EZV62_012871 [Acer yangbiense]